jgi:heterogeneous nuclear ribonucleoprotein U-like protein 1
MTSEEPSMVPTSQTKLTESNKIDEQSSPASNSNSNSNYIDYVDYGSEYVVIDPQNCDLNLIIDRECFLAYPISTEGFCQMWASCRATHGVNGNSGKVAFEVHLEDYCECIDLPKDDPEPFALRVGWSLNTSSSQLGEDEYSFGYCSNGKKCCNKLFEDYGESFDKGDSIGIYFDYKNDNKHLQISFSKNGIDLGVAFDLKLNELLLSTSTSFFYPHVLSKNIVFEMNFGQRVSLIGDEPFAPIKSGFELIQKVDPQKRIHSGFLPKDRKNCQVILVVGLPGSGKTEWCLNYIKENLNKRYSLISTSTIIEKMKVISFLSLFLLFKINLILN